MFRRRLHQTRTERGFTQQYMADLLGVTLNNYQKYEYGGSTPTLENLVKIADALDVSTDYLLCRDAFLSRQRGDTDP